jgi:predicted phage terminase large subunit-like protein
VSAVDQHALLEALHAARENAQVKHEREELSQNLGKFIEHAWKVLKPNDTFKSNWHIDAICDHLEAVSRFELNRLQVWVPPGSMKTLTVSVMWPCWEWTREPSLRYWTGSYQTDLSINSASLCLNLMTDHWYQERWGDQFEFLSTASHYFTNNKGGTRLSTSPESKGTGYHGHRIIIDDPIRAKDADRDAIDIANEWYDSTIHSRGIMWNDKQHARVLIMQRLHTEDLAAHMLEQEEWEVLCLPERYEPNHPFAWRKDPRTEDGELLWPTFRDETTSNAQAKGMTMHRAAGQMQQRPTALEGEILKREWWRFYDPRLRADDRWQELPKFTMVVQSVDTPLKDKQTNDNIAIQLWGVKGADRYLLDLRLGKMNYNQAKRAVTEQARWARRTWRSCRHFLLIENAGFGAELITDLKRDLTGVTKISQTAEGDKITRAITASDALESGNCFVPGYGPPWQPAYDEAKTPADVAEFLQNQAAFPNGRHDDDTDAWSMCMNWLRGRSHARMRTGSAFKRRA